MGYLIVAAMGYLIGCSNMAYYISRLKKVEFRDKGSGNLGASNATLLLGWRAGILVGVHDVLKAVLAVVLAGLLCPGLEHGAVVAGTACVLGHIFPFYLKFRGGKGFASFWGMTLALNWKLALVVGVLIILITVVTDYIVLATTMTVLTVPGYLALGLHLVMPALIILPATLVILWKHRMNYVRILKGEEFGLRGAIKGDKRVK